MTDQQKDDIAAALLEYLYGRGQYVATDPYSDKVTLDGAFDLKAICEFIVTRWEAM